ncbi:hypothetical protein KXD93_17685 [Mucilaginibacter sp. BJC16-A38]|uniref:hypothetical protein n=1 Tax=Mucilaginibacter phenanthrenivorans TaxID=1234842 RepID=UPI00215888B1|nr:hypothetical protein [Mucilaginibacter phenanthrenivorans]MCR8559494.1 hypothetical protein [Mucilaginibacter phenanthrenivorans]
MESDLEIIIRVLKMQAEAFLLGAKEFYPFGTYINKTGEIVPVGAYLGSDYSPSLPLIDLLEKDFKQGIENNEYKIAAIAVDGSVTEKGIVYDIMEIRFFETDKDIYKKYYKYKINPHSVDFLES